MKSRHRVAACMALWPVCDLLFHYAERVDLPRTMHHAFGSYEDIATPLREHSPLYQVTAMPDIPYLLIHGDKDQAVQKAAHSDRWSRPCASGICRWNTWNGWSWDTGGRWITRLIARWSILSFPT